MTNIQKSSKQPCKQNVVDIFNCLNYLISWCRIISTWLNYSIKDISHLPPRPPAVICFYLLMGGVNVLSDISHGHFTVFNFQIFQWRLFAVRSSGPNVVERYRRVIDIPRIAVIPDHRFLWWTSSLSLFSSACPNVSVGLLQSDSAAVPLPLTMRQSGGPSGFSDFSHQPVCVTGPNQSVRCLFQCM